MSTAGFESSQLPALPEDRPPTYEEVCQRMAAAQTLAKTALDRVAKLSKKNRGVEIDSDREVETIQAHHNARLEKYRATGRN